LLTKRLGWLDLEGWRDGDDEDNPPVQWRHPREDPGAVQAWHEAINAYRCGYWG